MDNKKKNPYRFMTITIFLIFVLGISLMNIFTPEETFSENENRVLAKFPSLSLSNVFGGDFDTQFETWFSDHFTKRDAWIQTKAKTELALGKIINNDIYFAKGDQMIGALNTINDKTFENNITYVKEFADSLSQKINVMIIPSAAYADKEKLPSGAYNLNEEELIEKVKTGLPDCNFIDISEEMKAQDDLYFKTDHHWNEKGAYVGYQAICKDVLLKKPEEVSFEKVADNFKGTYFSKSGHFWHEGDPLYRIDPAVRVRLDMELDGETKTDTLFIDENLKKKDKYTYYIDGNHSYVKISTNVDNEKKALIVKDSYTHILIPYLVMEYSEIELVDLRYYKKSVSELADEDTDIYVIYSISEFVNDKNIASLY